MRNKKGYVSGYNGQLVVTCQQVIVGAMLSQHPVDRTLLHPLLDTCRQQLTEAGIRPKLRTVLADAGYASDTNLTCPGPDRLIALGTCHQQHTTARDHPAHGDPPEHATARQRMHHRLRTPAGAARYRRRAALVEPVHAHLKDRRGLRRFARRGITAARSEYRFAATTTNLLRLHTHLAANPAT